MSAETSISGPVDLALTKSWIFDLDNTLYPAESRLFDQMHVNITQYVMNRLSLDYQSAEIRQREYVKTYGTTLKGMMEHHNVDPFEYMDYVHDIDLSSVPESPELKQLLETLPGRKFIFTNGSQDHARNVTSKIGIDTVFDGIFAIEDCDFAPKPELSAYTKMIERFGINPETAVMVEDMARNLVPAAELGMTTVWIKSELLLSRNQESLGEHIHHEIDDLIGWLRKIT